MSPVSTKDLPTCRNLKASTPTQRPLADLRRMTIAPQTYYRWLACPVRSSELEEAYLVNDIVDLYRKNRCVYGVRKMWHACECRERCHRV